MFKRLYDLASYNRDWASYIWCKYRNPDPEELLTFRLRNGQTATLRADARFILNEIYMDKVYDVVGVDYSQCRSILDIGANMGIFALYAAAQAPAATVYCFEPSSENFAVLQRNCAANQLRAKVYRMAVAGTSGVGHLATEKTSVEYALGQATESSEQVDCVDLAGVCRLTGERDFDFVKMDIEGAEREVFNSSPDETLLRMKALAIEWHHSWAELEALAARFRSLGFEAKPMKLQGQISYLVARRL